MATTVESARPASGTGSSVKVLTYNCGLLRLRVVGITVFSNPPYVDERFVHLAKALRESGADIIALQEIYERHHVSTLIAQLKDVYPHHAQQFSGWPHQFTNGLMFLSKYPVDESVLKIHAKAATMEKLMGSKSCLSATFDSPIGKLTMINMHTTAGGGVDPENPSVDGVRQDELAEACALADEATAAGCEALIVGDMNMGPESSLGNYNWILGEMKYRNIVTDLPDSDKMTWDPANPLNVGGVHDYCPPQWIDHFFAHEKCKVTGTDATIMFKEPVVKMKRKDLITTVSDHYGLIITLRVT